ncbi:MAG: hypothetical protein ACYDBY_13620 [Thermoanaerobaculia bacterium]
MREAGSGRQRPVAPGPPLPARPQKAPIEGIDPQKEDELPQGVLVSLKDALRRRGIGT